MFRTTRDTPHPSARCRRAPRVFTNVCPSPGRAMGSEIRRCHVGGNSIPDVWDIYRDERYVTTEPSAEAAEQCLQQLERCCWAYLDIYHSGLAPLELVAKVKEQRGWIRWQLDRFPSNKVLFRGVCSDGNYFSYQLFSRMLAATLNTALRRPSSVPAVAAQPAAVARPASPATQAPSRAANDGASRQRAAATAQAGPAKTQVPAGPNPGTSKSAPPAKPNGTAPTAKAPKAVQSAQLSIFD